MNNTPERNVVASMRDACRIYRMQDVETHALSHVDLDIREGEYLAVQGRSGSGKSTLLSALGLMDTLSTGTLRLFGRDAASLDRANRAMLRNQHLGFVFQFFHLIGDLTVEENVGLPMMYGKRPAAEIKARVAVLLDRLDLTARRRHKPPQLSGGQQQRVAIARALANEPQLLLVDEPTGNLDSESGAQVMTLLDEIHAEGRAICMVTHDPGCAAHASRQLTMVDGRIAEAGLTGKGRA